MKTNKQHIAISFLVIGVFMLGCSPTADIIEIGERLFIGQVNEIYLNANNYLGKTIKLEGIFIQEHWEGADYYFVIRNGPGCCGDDGVVGFQVAWAANQPYPEVQSWVEAIGVLESRRINDRSYLYLNLSSLTVLDRRGQEFIQP